MGQEVTVRLTDDIDGSSTAEETVVFGLDGITYNIDVNGPHAAELRADIGRWIEHARRATKARAHKEPGARRRRSTQGDAHAIREWAATQGISLSPRGRIPEHVVERYRRLNQNAA
jgi:hypothetical protein